MIESVAKAIRPMIEQQVQEAILPLISPNSKVGPLFPRTV